MWSTTIKCIFICLQIKTTCKIHWCYLHYNIAEPDLVFKSVTNLGSSFPELNYIIGPFFSTGPCFQAIKGSDFAEKIQFDIQYVHTLVQKKFSVLPYI